jgi:CDP-glucose 4,6-dehydratase
MKMDTNSFLSAPRTKKPILVTGHTGFKGTWLTLLLKQLGFEVIGYSLEPSLTSLYSQLNLKGTLTEVYADITDKNSLHNFIEDNKPFGVFHLAAQPLVIESYKYPYETFSVNTLGTINILDVATKTNSIDFIGVVTTDKVYHNLGRGNKFNESDPLCGFDPYSESKVAAEAAIRAWQKIAEIEKGPKILSLRAGNVIGGGDLGQNRLLPDIVRSIYFGAEISIRNSNSTRPWQHVLDVLYGYILASEKSAPSASYNFAPDGESLSVKKILEIAKSFDPKLNFKNEKNLDDYPETKYLELDNKLAKQELGWEPIFTQEQAVVSTLEWWAKFKNGKKPLLELCINDIQNYLTLLSIKKS